MDLGETCKKLARVVFADPGIVDLLTAEELTNHTEFEEAFKVAIQSELNKARMRKNLFKVFESLRTIADYRRAHPEYISFLENKKTE